MKLRSNFSAWKPKFPEEGKPVRRLSVRCILFDLDGTLYESPEYCKRLEAEIVKVVSEELDLDEAHARRILNDRRKKIGTLTRTIEGLGIDRKFFYQTIAKRVEPRLYISPDQQTRKTIRHLRKNGFRIGLVSNSGRPLVQKILGALHLELNLFDVIVTSTEAQPKPSQEPFRLAMERIGCRGKDTVYVGDREEAELRPAHELRLRTVLVSRRGEQKNAWVDAVVTSVSEIPQVVERK